MYRIALRAASRPAVAGRLQAQALRSAPRRFASTSPADKSRSWKGSLVRWGLAGAAVYYYTTSTVFAEEAIPAKHFSTAPSSFHEPIETTQLPTIEAIVQERKSQAAAKAEEERKKLAESKPAKDQTKGDGPAAETTAAVGSPADLQEEADQQGAFNPETGEINWDCPCLGGMADGPCGEEFKTAFSCFVYSKEEPKGMECIEKFQGMQECFRRYPELYGAELADADDEGDVVPTFEEPTDGKQSPHEAQATENQASNNLEEAEKKAVHNESTTTESPYAPKQQEAEPAKSKASPAAVPEAKADAPSTSDPQGPKWEDATGANEEAPK